MNSKNRSRATHVAIVKNMKQDVSTRRSLSTAGYTATHMHTYTHMHACTHACSHAHTQTHTQVHTHTHTSTRTHTHTYTHTYTYTRTGHMNVYLCKLFNVTWKNLQLLHLHFKFLDFCLQIRSHPEVFVNCRVQGTLYPAVDKDLQVETSYFIILIIATCVARKRFLLFS